MVMVEVVLSDSPNLNDRIKITERQHCWQLLLIGRQQLFPSIRGELFLPSGNVSPILIDSLYCDNFQLIRIGSGWNQRESIGVSMFRPTAGLNREVKAGMDSWPSKDHPGGWPKGSTPGQGAIVVAEGEGPVEKVRSVILK